MPTGAYRTRDGWIMVAIVREEQFARLAGVLGRPDLVLDPGFADFAQRAHHAAALGEIIAAIFPTDTTTAWLARLRAADILAERISGFDDWLADPHIRATGGAVAIDQPGMGQFHVPRTPGVSAAADAALSPAPGVGEQSREILRGLGFQPAAIAQLAADGIVRVPEVET